MASLVKTYGWYEWLCHTNFSFLIGASHPGEMVETAVKYGYLSLGITDYDGVYGIARAYRVRQKLLKKEVKRSLRLRYGAEIHLAPDHNLPLCLQDTLILYALSHEGYFNLCSLLTLAHRGGKKEAHLSMDDLLAHPVNDLIAILPMRGVIRRGEGEHIRGLAERYAPLKEHLKGRFYSALSRHLNQAEDRWIPFGIALSKELEISTLLCQDVFFHTKGRKALNDVLHAIRCNRTMSETGREFFINAERRLHSLEELEKIYAPLPGFEASLKTSKNLSEMFHFDLHELTYHYPKEMIPAGLTAQEFLESLAWEHARKIYGTLLPDKVEHLLRHELQLVNHLSFADYFLTVWDIVRWARSQDILCQGRGSAANSAVCYVLGITAVDPSRFDLLFERFISVERGEPPDIDVDFEHERREEVIQYIYKRFGRDRAAMVANVVTFKSKGAMRFVGKALGIPEGLLSHASQILDVRDTREFRGNRFEKTVALAREDYLKRTHDSSDKLDCISDYTFKLWAAFANELRGFPRHLGIHSGGFVVSDLPIHRLAPTEPATMPGRTVIAWCKEDIEALGFFKIDILALGILTAIKKCLAMIRENYKKDLRLTTIPPEDPATYQMIQGADTVGVFQIESRAQMSMLPRLKPKNFYDLVVEVAIIRPGPIQGGMIHPYLRRRNGEEPLDIPDPRLEPILKRTYGVPIFQEQVMRVAMAVGGFTAGQADELRKNIGSFSIHGDVDLWIGNLESGMRKNGIKEDFIQGILGQIRGFSSYGFPESHAASFALLAYASAFLKCHFPAAYFAALLNAQPMGFYSRDTLIKTAERLGVQILPICVNHSEWDAKLEVIAGKGQREFGVRLGFHLIRGVCKEQVKAFVARRKEHGAWDHLETFLKEARLSRLDLTALAAANALKVLNVDRKDSIWLAEAAPYAQYLEERETKVLFPEESELEAVQADYQATSTSLGRHPTLLIKEHAWVFDVPIEKLALGVKLHHLASGTWVFVFGMVIVRQAPPTAGGMVFLTLEDETALMNLVVKPSIYAKYGRFIEEQSFLLVLGRLERKGDANSITVTQIFSPRMKRSEVIPLYPESKSLVARESVFDRSRNYM